MAEQVHIFGIRHHGPGSARSLLRALETLQPDCILVEGPPDAQEVIQFAIHEEMKPPVAILVYRPDVPKDAVYYPFAEFSPEWQAIRFGVAAGTPVRFIDLPQAIRLAEEKKVDDEPDATPDEPAPKPLDDPPPETNVRQDPLRWIAEAAGYSDSERWWEHQFEERRDANEAFAAVLELMTALRAEAEKEQPSNPLEMAREAHMRQMIRAAQKEGFARIAVIVGAWHAPALAVMPSAKHDADILKGRDKVKVAATWVPWTHGRLSFWTGYGAGIESPGYYEELWRTQKPGERGLRWLTRVAHLMRAEQLEGSTASIIEAVRLADTLAAIRGRPVPGLVEFNEAARSVFCFGDDLPLRLIERRLIVGERLGEVPDATPMVPLQSDLRREQKRLRLPPEADERTLELDLRKPNDLDRSRVLHRLAMLGIAWGKAAQAAGKGTFKEAWRLRWEPEFEVKLIESAVWGNSVAGAASGKAIAASLDGGLPELSALVEKALLADLPDALDAVMHALNERAAVSSDTGLLMDALPPLANVSRYGNVRQSDTALISTVMDGLIARICVGVSAACASLGEDAATEMKGRIESTDAAIRLVQHESHLADWTSALARLTTLPNIHGLVTGRATRLLFDDGKLPAEEVARHLSLALSRANNPVEAAAWIEGFLSGSGMLLLHQNALWSLIDNWLASLTGEHFQEMLPLLRRTFGAFQRPERVQLLERAKAGAGAAASQSASAGDESVNVERARLVLPTVACILGIERTTI